MALTGNITWTFVEQSETETEESLVTYPDGTQETVVNPKQETRTEDFENVYLYIKSIQVHTLTINGEKIEHLHYHYAGYESKEVRDENNENFLFFNSQQLLNYDHDTNIWSQCYDSLKLQEELSELENC